MSRLADVLELLYREAYSWQTVRAVGADLSGAVDSPRLSEGGGLPPQRAEEWRLWVRRPDCIRAEYTVLDEPITAVLVGSEWWSWSPHWGARTNAGHTAVAHGAGPGVALFDTRRLIPVLDFEITGEDTVAERRALVVSAKPSALARRHPEWGIHLLNQMADEYNLTVDAERGILLGATFNERGVTLGRLAIDTVSFDEEFPAETFQLIPPDGSTFEVVGPPSPPSDARG